MLATQKHPERSKGGVLGKPKHDLRLRILGPHGETRAVRVSSRKYTIGAADTCSLRLLGPGLSPVHCMIVRGARGTIVRSLSSDNRLNGRPFEDAELLAGDQLQIANYEIEVLPIRQRRSRRSRRVAGEDTQLPATLNLTAAIETRMNRLEDQLVTIQRHQTSSKLSRLRKIVERLSLQLSEQEAQHSDERQKWAGEREELLAVLENPALTQASPQTTPSADSTEHPAFVLAEDLTRLTAELDEAQQEQRAQKDRWQVERSELESQLAETHERISALEGELARHQQGAANFVQQREAFEARVAELTDSLAELTARLEQLQQEHAGEKEAWQAARDDVESQLDAARTKLGATSDRLQEVERELDSQQAATAESRQQFEQERQQLAQEQESLREQLAASDAAARDSQLQVEHWEHEYLALNSRATELEQQITGFETTSIGSDAIAESAEEVARLQQELAQLQATHEQQTEEWDAERQRLVGELNSASQDVDQQGRKLAELEESSAQRTAEWENERSELQAALQEASESLQEITDPQQELEDQLAQLRREVEYWQSKAEQPAAADDDVPPTPEASPVERLGTDAVAPEEAWDDTGADTGHLLEQTTSEPVGEESEPVEAAPSHPRGAPVNTAEVLARLGHGELLDEPDSNENAPTANQSAPAASVLAEALQQDDHRSSEPAADEGGPEPLASAAAADSASEENAIEDYMNRLLERVRGEQAPTEAPVHHPARTPITETPWQAKTAPEPEQPPEEATGEYLPRSVAPEHSDSLAAMRSLANDSARSAIARHAVRNWMEVAKYQIFGATIGITMSAVSFVAIASQPLMGGVGIISGIALTAIFGAQALSVRRALLTHAVDPLDEDLEALEAGGLPEQRREPSEEPAVEDLA